MIITILVCCMQFTVNTLYVHNQWWVLGDYCTSIKMRDMVKTCIAGPIALDTGRTVDRASSSAISTVSTEIQ